MVLAFVIGVLLILAVAGLCAYFPTFAKIVGIINNAGLFLIIVFIGILAIGNAFLSLVH
jgi:hypothetical protein